MNFNTLVLLATVPSDHLKKSLPEFAKWSYLSFDYDEYRNSDFWWMIMPSSVRTPADIFLYSKDEVVKELERRASI